MDFASLNKEAETLAKLLADSDLAEISIKIGEATICVKAKQPAMTTIPAAPQATAQEPAAPTEKNISGNVVKSPIVGTFYSSPAPDKPPFVKVGDKVEKGDTLFIIESMKLMNEIQSTFDGTITEISVSDGTALEYGQPVMIIE